MNRCTWTASKPVPSVFPFLAPALTLPLWDCSMGRHFPMGPNSPLVQPAGGVHGGEAGRHGHLGRSWAPRPKPSTSTPLQASQSGPAGSPLKAASVSNPGHCCLHQDVLAGSSWCLCSCVSPVSSFHPELALHSYSARAASGLPLLFHSIQLKVVLPPLHSPLPPTGVCLLCSRLVCVP